MKSEIRVGKVSAVNYKTGMVRVVYTDRENETTAEMPYVNCNDEYSMPKIGSSVVTAHLSNGSSRGVVIGQIWNKKNQPEESGKNIYRKELSKTKGAAYCRYDDGTGEYLVKAPRIKFIGLNKVAIESIDLAIDTKLLEAIVEKLVIKALGDMLLKTDANLKLEDGVWSTTLSRIMNRLEALDGDKSDRK